MRSLVLKFSMSLDGFSGGPGGEVDWVFPTIDREAQAWLVDGLWQAGVHLMGSVTYRDMAAYWPTSDEPYAAPMNRIPKVVFSRTLQEASWPGTGIARGDLAEELARLKRAPGKDLLAHGGARFARSLLGAGLVDELRVLVHPVIVGSGLRFFPDGYRPVSLRLVGSTRFPAGAVAQVYRRA